MTEIENILRALKSQIKINRFEQLTPADCLLVYETVKQNSLDHLAIADILAEKGKYGSAITHTVLASEEMTKALILYVNGIGIRLSNVKGFKSFFYRHTPRHKLANFMIFFNLILKPMNELLQSIKKDNNIDKEAINTLLDKHKNTFEDTIDDIEWWTYADTLKNKGLYVDYRNKTISPSDLKEEDFKLALKTVANYVIFCENLLSTLRELDENNLNNFRKISKTKQYRELLETVFSSCASTD